MIHNKNVIYKAKKLRKEGNSFGEISKKINVAKSTAYLWVNRIELDKEGKKRLEKKRVLARLKALKVLKDKRDDLKEDIKKLAVKTIKKIHFSKETKKILCAFLYWGEGSKNTNSLIFTNSDPEMIKTFLNLLRSSFLLDESKFRALLHVHEYHNEKEIKNYWSKIANIPLSQFSKSYLKPHTKKNIRTGYKGTISISYYDYKIALELRFIYNRLAESLRNRGRGEIGITSVSKTDFPGSSPGDPA